MVYLAKIQPKTLFITLLLMLTFLCESKAAHDHPVHFRRVSPEGGFTEWGVFDIVEDHLGFIWIGTASGVIKYDARSFTRYTHNNKTEDGLSSPMVRDLLVDPQQNLWVATTNGLNRFNRYKQQFERVYFTDSAFSEHCEIPSLAMGHDGKLLIASANKLFHYDPVHHTSQISQLPYSGLKSVIRGDGHDTYIIYVRKGIYRLSGDGKLQQIIPGQPHGVKAAIFHKGLLHVGYDGSGVMSYSSDGKKIKEYSTAAPDTSFQLNSDHVRSLFIDHQDRIWIGTYHGLNMVDHNGTYHYTSNDVDPYTLPHNSVYSIYEDHNHGYWFGTWSGGLAYYHPSDNIFSSFKHIAGLNSLNNNYVSSFAEDPDGNVYIGTEGGGLNFLNSKTQQFSTIPLDATGSTHTNVKALHTDNEGHIWMGTFKEGVYVINADNKKVIRHIMLKDTADQLFTNKIYSFAEDEQGIWLGDYGSGVFYFDKSTRKIHRKFYSASSKEAKFNDHVTCLLSYDTQLWIGTNDGLFVASKNRNNMQLFEADRYKPSSHATITCLYKDAQGRIWIGTRGSGISCFNPENNTVQQFDQQDGLPGNDVNGILSDDYGHLWISTENGVAQLDIQSGNFRSYNTLDGLQAKLFNPRASLKKSDGSLFFGGTNGFSVIDPSTINTNAQIPSVIIDKLFISNKLMIATMPDSPLDKPVSETDHIELKYYQSSITLEFVTPNYVNPQKTQYAYRLKNFEETWSLTDNPKAVYTNLPAGNYVFEVKASNNEGFWNKQPTRLMIVVQKPWWATYWAYAVYGLIIGTVLYLIIRQMIVKERLKSEVKLERILRQKEHELHEMKSRFFTNISHEFKTPLTLILSPLQNTLRDKNLPENVANDLKLAQKNALRMKHLVGQLIDLRKADQGKLILNPDQVEVVDLCRNIYSCFREWSDRKNIQYTFSSTLEAWHQQMDKEKIEIVAFNLLSNAFHHTPDSGSIHLSIYPLSEKPAKKTYANYTSTGMPPAGEGICIVLEDSGDGISRETIEHIFERFYTATYQQRTGSGIGLSVCKEYTQLHEGCIEVFSTENMGTCFILSLPACRVSQEKQYLWPVEEKTQHTFKELTQSWSTEQPKSSYQPKQRSSKRNHKVLIVEDNDEMRDYLKSSLQSEFQVITAKNGKEGLKQAQTYFPDLVLSDIMMPETDGFVLCKMFKSEILTSHIPIILLTALSAEDYEIKGIEQGADLYLTKPFNLQVLRSHIYNLIETRRRLRTSFACGKIINEKAVSYLSVDERFLEQAEQFVLEKLSDPGLSSLQLAQELCMSRTNLHRKLKSLTNMSATQYIKSIRLNKATAYIQEGPMNIDEIGALVGFNSTTYFSTCFKGKYGISPSEYQNRLRSSNKIL